jgi:LDH2 family malate/lactate/ureidoglycolate dehydrogenase
MDELLDELKEAPVAAGVDTIYFPGEPEDHTAAMTLRDGLRLPEQTVADLRELADDAGVARPDWLGGHS